MDYNKAVYRFFFCTSNTIKKSTIICKNNSTEGKVLLGLQPGSLGRRKEVLSGHSSVYEAGAVRKPKHKYQQKPIRAGLTDNAIVVGNRVQRMVNIAPEVPDRGPKLNIHTSKSEFLWHNSGTDRAVQHAEVFQPYREAVSGSERQETE